jgi:hypothetical protein
MPAFKPKRVPAINLTDMILTPEVQRVIAARRVIFQKWIDDVVEGRAA